jgi:hypothetical protein
MRLLDTPVADVLAASAICFYSAGVAAPMCHLVDGVAAPVCHLFDVAGVAAP